MTSSKYFADECSELAAAVRNIPDDDVKQLFDEWLPTLQTGLRQIAQGNAHAAVIILCEKSIVNYIHSNTLKLPRECKSLYMQWLLQHKFTVSECDVPVTFVGTEQLVQWPALHVTWAAISK